jgi:hypothetical protein
MATATHRKRHAPVHRRVPRTYRLTPAKIEAAKHVLGVKTATEAIEEALDLVVSRHQVDGHHGDKPWMTLAGLLEGRSGDSESVDDVVYGRTRP